jgi:cellulose synthase/poly-beta-1,6-N-acetylglucosamine synthase-like glycosyltransferase
MCFNKAVIKKYFQDDYSISEDIDFSLRLIKENMNIAFAHEAYVESISPDNVKAASTQRTRWGSGTFLLLRKYLPFFLLNGIAKRSLIYIDTAFTLLSWSKPIIGLIFVITLFVTYFVGAIPHLIVWALLLLEVIYICLGIILLKKYNYNYRSLLKAPILLPWFFFITLIGLLGYKKREWKRTDRL